MKKSLLQIALISVLGMGFTGCATSTPPLSLTPLVKEEIVLSSNTGKISKGALILKDGSKIFDSEGDILTSFVINNETFYILKVLVKNESHFKIKNSSKVVIEEFKANAISWFVDDNKFLLLTKLERNQSTIYDNVYNFDGKTFKLINKNLDLSGSQGYHKTFSNPMGNYNIGVSKSGIYGIEILYGADRKIIAQRFSNMLKEETFELDKIKKEYRMDARILGIRNDIVYVTYSTAIFGGQNILEAYDIVNKKSYVLSTDDDKIQFLQSGNEVVLKVFNNKNLKFELELHSHVDRKDVKTAYNNEPARIISLNTLKEVKSLSSDFEVIPVYTGFTNMAGTFTPKTDITFTTTNLHHNMYLRNMKPLF